MKSTFCAIINIMNGINTRPDTTEEKHCILKDRFEESPWNIGQTEMEKKTQESLRDMRLRMLNIFLLQEKMEESQI